jgi:hypothetical protein
MELESLTPREASIFACLADAYCAPAGDLPSVRETGTVEFFDDWLSRVPALNQAGFRALLYMLEMGPFVSGYGHRFRQLEPERRREYLRSLDRSRVLALRGAAKLMKVATSLGYYGDDAVLRHLGYDREALLRRSRELRRAEGRP